MVRMEALETVVDVSLTWAGKKEEGLLFAGLCELGDFSFRMVVTTIRKGPAPS